MSVIVSTVGYPVATQVAVTDFKSGEILFFAQIGRNGKTWLELHEHFIDAVVGKNVIMYDSQKTIETIENVAREYELTTTFIAQSIECVMRQYSYYRQEPAQIECDPDSDELHQYYAWEYKTFELLAAINQERIDLQGFQTFSAISKCAAIKQLYLFLKQALAA